MSKSYMKSKEQQIALTYISILSLNERRFEERKQKKLRHEGVDIISICLTNGGTKVLYKCKQLTINNY